MQSSEEIQNIKTLAQKHELELQGDIEINEIGLDFKVAFGRDGDGQDWVLRIPRRADVLPKAQQEYKTLQLLKKDFAAEVPDWKIHTEELIAYPRLSGIPAVAVDLEKGQHVWQIDRESSNFDKSFAKTLASLHSISVDEAAKTEIPVFNVEEIRLTIAKNIEIVNKELGISVDRLKRWDAWLNNDASWNFKPALIHGDIHQAHLLVNKSSEVTGVLDWTEAEVADPANDFIFHLLAFGEDALKDLLQEYEQAGGAIWDGMAAHIAESLSVISVKHALYAVEINNTELIEVIRKQLNN